jgi:hypothetical protein
MQNIPLRLLSTEPASADPAACKHLVLLVEKQVLQDLLATLDHPDNPEPGMALLSSYIPCANQHVTLEVFDAAVADKSGLLYTQLLSDPAQKVRHLTLL